MIRLVDLNINDKVRVELTEYGRDILRKHEPYRISAFRATEEGKHRFILWELMLIFGPSVRMGAPIMPFIKNKLELETSI